MGLLSISGQHEPWWPVPPTLLPSPAQETPSVLTTYVGRNATIHPSVLDMVAITGKPISGYRWLLLDTPFPPDGEENPCIWGSNDRITWEVPSGMVNPIYPWQGAGFNSDTELVWDAEKQHLVAFWRDYHSTPEGVRILAATSPDAINWTVLPNPVLKPFDVQICPTVEQGPDGLWRMWFFGERSLPRMYTAPTPLGPWTDAGRVTLKWHGADHGTLNWHGGILWHRGMWIGAFSLRPAPADMCIFVSKDGLTWHAEDTTKIYGYRPTLQRSTEPGEIDMWIGQREAYSKYGPRNLYWRLPETDWLALAAKAGITPGP